MKLQNKRDIITNKKQFIENLENKNKQTTPDIKAKEKLTDTAFI